MKEYITSFGVPITSKVVGGTMEELQDSISEKLSAMNEKAERSAAAQRWRE